MISCIINNTRSNHAKVNTGKELNQSNTNNVTHRDYGIISTVAHKLKYSMFDNNFDPYEELLKCQHNVRELIKAYAHQQEVIEQLMFQVNKLQDNHRQQSIKQNRLEVELELLRHLKV